MITAFFDENRFLSNFHPCNVEFEGIVFPSVEHAYQAAKTIDPVDREMFSRMKTPGMAKRQGRLIVMRDDWEDIKVLVMWGLLYQKFKHPELRQMLLATGTQQIIEGNTWNDTFWGECPIGTGSNTLGKLLMDVRTIIKLF